MQVRYQAAPRSDGFVLLGSDLRRRCGHRSEHHTCTVPPRRGTRYSRLARVNTPARSVRKAALAFIFVTVLIDMLAFGMIIPVLPVLVQNFMRGSAAHAAQMYGVFGTAWALMQFIFSPVQGSLSDHFGRRPVVLISCAGLGLDFILMALAPNLWWLLVGRVIFRYHGGQLQHGRCLHFRRHATGEARCELWTDRGRVRRRICTRTGARRSPRRHLTATAVLGFRLPGVGQRMLGTVRAA
jgi:hypothetical protein